MPGVQAQQLLDAQPELRSECASLIDEAQRLLGRATTLADQLDEPQARDFLNGASLMAARGNASLVRGQGQ